MASDMSMPSATVASAPAPILAAPEYGALLNGNARTPQWKPPPGWNRTQSQSRTRNMTWRMWCSRSCARLVTIGCSIHIFGVRIKMDLWRLPQVLLILYVGSLLWSTLGLPIPRLHSG